MSTEGAGVEIELQDICAVVGEHPLEGVDLGVALGPDRARNHFVHTLH